MLTEGQSIKDRFTIIKKLGEGGFGAVYHAYDKDLARDVALKVSKPTQDSEGHRRFKREAKALARLVHPNIMRIFAIEELDNQLTCLVTEYIEGKSVKQILESREHGLEQDDVVLIMTDLAKALAYAHKAGLLHRDLSPQNIMVVEENGAKSAKLIDFGLCRYFDQTTTSTLTATGLIIGNPSYMSPEACRGEKVDQRSDLYSLACILYEMLAGKAPFQASTNIGILFKQQSEYPDEPLFNWTDAQKATHMKAIALRGLQKRKENRFQSADDFLDSLSSVSERKQSTNLDSWGLKPKETTVIQKKNQRSKVSWTAPLIAIAILGLSIAFFAIQSHLPVNSTQKSKKKNKGSLVTRIESLLESQENSYWLAISNYRDACDLSRQNAIPLDLKRKAIIYYDPYLFSLSCPTLTMREVYRINDSSPVILKSYLESWGAVSAAWQAKKVLHLSSLDEENEMLKSSAKFFGSKGIPSNLDLVGYYFFQRDYTKAGDDEGRLFIELCKDPRELLKLAGYFCNAGKPALAKECVAHAARLNANQTDVLALSTSILILEQEGKPSSQLQRQLLHLLNSNKETNQEDATIAMQALSSAGRARDAMQVWRKVHYGDNSVFFYPTILDMLKEQIRRSPKDADLANIDDIIPLIPKREEQCSMICFRTGKIPFFSDPKLQLWAHYAYEQLSPKFSRELRLQILLGYALQNQQNGFDKKSETAINEFLEDLKKNGFPKHSNIAGAIDKDSVGVANLLLAKIYLRKQDFAKTGSYLDKALETDFDNVAEMLPALVRVAYSTTNQRCSNTAAVNRRESNCEAEGNKRMFRLIEQCKTYGQLMTVFRESISFANTTVAQEALNKAEKKLALLSGQERLEKEFDLQAKSALLKIEQNKLLEAQAILRKLLKSPKTSLRKLFEYNREGYDYVDMILTLADMQEERDSIWRKLS
ncbi:MAG: protein kinase [Candidatus Obscuribacterales bacterium]|nr:protein kinase [Candidatus Obscuribacterales bacterium]